MELVNYFYIIFIKKSKNNRLNVLNIYSNYPKCIKINVLNNILFEKISRKFLLIFNI